MCFKSNQTEMEFVVLPDGTIKVLTGNVQMGDVHLKANEFMEFLAKELGGNVNVTKRPKVAHHHHTHRKEVIVK